MPHDKCAGIWLSRTRSAMEGNEREALQGDRDWLEEGLGVVVCHAFDLLHHLDEGDRESVAEVDLDR